MRKGTLAGLLLGVGLAAAGCLPARSIDGSGNNPDSPLMGASETPLLRLMEADYGDGIDSMAGADRPGPREVSNLVHAQERPRPNPRGASDFVWQWGQFLDHDIDLSPEAEPAEAAPIPVPACDAHFDPFCTGAQVIPFHRSAYAAGTGAGTPEPRAQMNAITAWIDASNVYGSDPERAAALRTLDGSGRLATSAGGLLPFNHAGLPNAGGPGPELFLAGDVRANEQVALTALHTLFVREHNLVVRWLRAFQPDWSGDRLYEAARAFVGAEIQAITYEEFLPALLGRHALRPYRGYDPGVDASIANLFSTACFRFGHSMLSPTLLRLDRRGREIPAGHLPLRDAFFAPQRLRDEGGIEPLLRGLARQRAQAVDVYVVDDVRNLLFGPPGAGGLDLAALNLQRGRDHGLPGYNAARAAMGLRPARGFADVSSDPAVQARLRDAYGDVERLDLWTGGLAEDPVAGSLVGELVHTVLVDQFERLRDGDAYWYERNLPPALRERVRQTRLSQVIRRNTRIGRELPADVFRVARRR